MRIKLPIIVFVLLMSAAVHPLFGGDVIDRIVATVNGHIILQSDLDDELDYQAFTAGKSVQQFTAQERKTALDRLVDQELLRQQMPDNDPQLEIPEPDINTRLQEIRQQFPEAGNDQAWQALLARYNLSQDDLRKHVTLQVKVLRLIDEHLTSTIQIEDKSIETYYNQTFVPQVRQKGAKEPPLAEVTPKIRELLTQQKLNDALKEWMQNLHDSSTIVMKTGEAASK
ncbi:MAG TPA: SurA N-terminal domain-containing protein [Terriglobales bacterium]|nr:SurA N-terminal domain-containing protein [Terriglobales bacterium]